MTRAPFLCLGLAYLAIAISCGGAAVNGDAGPGNSDEDAISLEPTFDSPEALGKAFVEALAREDGATLNGYALTEAQFKHYVWPQLPSSRPERNVSFEFGWADLHQKSHNALLHTFSKYKGIPFEFREIRFEDGATDYDTYVVHRDARVLVRRNDGREEWLDLFGSVMEHDGRYKLFSYVTD